MSPNCALLEFFWRELERRAAARADALRVAAQPECQCAFHIGIAVLARQNH